MNEDVISRKWLMKCVNDGWVKFDTEKDENIFIDLIKDIAPSARPKGKWISVNGSAHGVVSKVVKCSLCNKNAGLSEEYFWYLSKFCPNCGAEMDLENGNA